MTWSQIAAALPDPSSAVAQGFIGSADCLTAAICTLTGNQPSTACTATIGHWNATSDSAGTGARHSRGYQAG